MHLGDVREGCCSVVNCVVFFSPAKLADKSLVRSLFSGKA